MSSFKDKCIEYYNTTDFYEVLGINRNATEKQINKAYHKLSLLVHPDRVGEGDKHVATEKFKVLGKIHSILQDKDKRKIYDDCGDFDDEADSTFNWMQYWLSMFKKIEIKDIENYEKEYIGSETEKRDIKRAYVGSKGNMDKILEMVPFSNIESEPRIIEVVRAMVDNGEVQEYKSFFNEAKDKKRRRHTKLEKERKECEKINMKEVQKEVESNRRKRAEDFGNFLSGLEEKYAPKKKVRKSITDGSEKKTRTRSKKRRRRRRKYSRLTWSECILPFVASLFGYGVGTQVFCDCI